MGAVDLTAMLLGNSKLPWDVRNPPSPDELDAILQDIGFTRPEPAPEGATVAALEDTSLTRRLSRVSRSVTAELAPPQEWTLRALTEGDEDVLQIVFAVSVDAGSPPNESGSDGDDDAEFWGDIFQPLHNPDRTQKDQKRFLEVCG